MIKALFVNIDNLEPEEIRKAFEILEFILKILCKLGFHEVVEDDGDYFCLHCKDYKGEKPLKDNFITNYLKLRHWHLGGTLMDFDSPYASY